MVVKLSFLLLLIVIFEEAVGRNLTDDGTNLTDDGTNLTAHGTTLTITNNANGTRLQISTRSGAKRYSVYRDRLTWPQALLFCRRRKKHLATISNEDQHQSVRDEVNRLAKTWEGVNLKKFWVGGGVEGSDWIWGTTGKQLDYVIWAKGQPKPKNLCLQVNGNDDFKFVSGKCEDAALAICQS